MQYKGYRYSYGKFEHYVHTYLFQEYIGVEGCIRVNSCNVKFNIVENEYYDLLAKDEMDQMRVIIQYEFEYDEFELRDFEEWYDGSNLISALKKHFTNA